MCAKNRHRAKNAFFVFNGAESEEKPENATGGGSSTSYFDTPLRSQKPTVETRLSSVRRKAEYAGKWAYR